MIPRPPWRDWLLLLILAVLTSPSPGLPAGVIVGTDCVLAWDAPVPATGITAYRLYWSHTPGHYPQGTPAATVQAPTTRSTCSALKLPSDGQYYAVATSYNGVNGQESDFSNEVPFVRDTQVPPPPTGLGVGP